MTTSPEPTNTERKGNDMTDSTQIVDRMNEVWEAFNAARRTIQYGRTFLGVRQIHQLEAIRDELEAIYERLRVNARVSASDNDR